MKRFLSFFISLVLLVLVFPLSSFAAGSSMKASEQLKDFVKSKEGLRLEAYLIPGEENWTIGYGHATSAVYEGQVITLDEANAYFDEDIKQRETIVNNIIDKYKLKLNQSQFDALVSFSYSFGGDWVTANRGIWRIADYVANGFKYSNGNPIPDQEIADAFGVIIAKDTSGNYMEGLITRRIQEAQIFLYGDYSTECKNFVFAIYNLNGGELESGNRVVIYTKNKPYGQLAEVQKSGVYFDGWKSSNGYWYGGADIAKSNQHFTAHWRTTKPADKYQVTVNDGFGTGKFAAGKNVCLSPMDKQGLYFTGWSTSSGVNITEKNGYYYFTMPAKDVTVTANYSETVEKYTLTVNDAIGSGSYAAGQKVYISPLPPSEKPGYRIKGWTSPQVWIKGSRTAGYYIIMPSKDVTVTALYEQGCYLFENCPSLGFTDIPQTHWAHSEIDFCLDSGLMLGTGDGLFDPETPMTRAQAVTVLYRIADTPVENDSSLPYSDVSPDDYYYDAVTWAKQNRITVDDGYGLFNPDEFISREEFATYLLRFANYYDYDTENDKFADLGSFSDSGKVGEPYRMALEWAVGQGLIIGTDEGTLEPAQNATRAEVCTMLYRFLNTYHVL